MKTQTHSNAAPTDADVEALAQIIRAEYEGPKRYEWQYSAYKDEWRAAARAAFAHIGAPERPKGLPTSEEWTCDEYGAVFDSAGCFARLTPNKADRIVTRHNVALREPVGLPTVEELAQVYWVGRDDGTIFNNIRPICKKQTIAGINAILATLAPYLREPVGWTLDVTPDELFNEWNKADSMDVPSWQTCLDLCRSRIKPVYECKECANERKRGDKWADDCVTLAGRIRAARAALEGDA